METLEKYQRLNLINQYEILLDLAISRKDDYMAEKYKQYIKILESGYVGEYYMLFENISDEFSKEESELVWDILQIYSNIQYSYRKLKNPKITEAQIRFDGFDGNNEICYLAFCEFVLFDLHRFGELQENGRRDFNSHSRRCDKYKAMQEKWIAMDKPFEMSEKDIEYLLSR
ncbi:MAG: YfbU family protein [Clostridia bacterium]|nr:YfbU family protein [Clostridia bacterium]